jgi:HTH-type transcriptional regulator / antitoxin HigA
MRTEIVTVENDRDLAEAQAIIAQLGASEDPADAARLRAQALILEAYEAERWPVEAATPAEILAYIMEQHDLSPNDLRPVLGGGANARASEILGGKKGFSLPQIRRMKTIYGVSADLLIAEPSPVTA